jgi:hypothetical protein
VWSESGNLVGAGPTQISELIRCYFNVFILQRHAALLFPLVLCQSPTETRHVLIEEVCRPRCEITSRPCSRRMLYIHFCLLCASAFGCFLDSCTISATASEELKLIQLFKNFPAFCRIRNFNTVFLRAVTEHYLKNTNPVYILQHKFFKICFNIIFLSAS